MDEWETRRRLIDPALEAAGWSPIVRYAPGATYDPAAGTKVEERALGRRVKCRGVLRPLDLPPDQIAD
ncbi:MAG TPA: hypothetical protein VFF86_02195 [Candidatus Methylomirabilis sp.]|jgi:hypothetical protein|nr:hypothetical protein [Candidatus Methylomirabilis sp.]